MTRTMHKFVWTVVSVVMVSAIGSASAAVWTDDFESYADDAALRAVWDSDLYPGAYLPTSGVIGDIAHTGGQSLKLRWNGYAGVRGLGGSYGTGQTVDLTAFIYAETDAHTLRVQFDTDANNWNSSQTIAQFTVGDHFGYLDDAGSIVEPDIAPVIESGTWYKLQMIAHPNVGGRGTVDIYLDDQSIVQGVGYNSHRGDATTTVRFGIFGDPDDTATNHYYVDDVTVSVPEPASLVLLGLGGLLMFRRNRSV